MYRKGRDLQNWDSHYEQHKEQFKALYKKKSDILLLKKNPDQPIEWPLEIKLPAAEKTSGEYISDLSNSRPGKRLKSRLYDYSTATKQDTRLTTPTYRLSTKKNHVQAVDYMNEFINHFLSHQLKPQPKKEMNEKTVGFIQDLSLDLLDNVLLSMVNSRVPETNNPLDWEFTMGNILQLGLPSCVTDRVKRRMALTTGKNTPAITAMNVTRPLLSDLTITSAEVEMKKEIQKLISKNESFESFPEDEPFQDSVKWLIDLDKKDQFSKDKEIENVHLDYTSCVLDLKPAFF